MISLPINIYYKRGTEVRQVTRSYRKKTEHKNTQQEWKKIKD